MAIIKSFAPFQNLSNFQVFLNDTAANSQYFRITELGETLTGGKNGFLIEGSEYLKESTEVKIEILDVEGNPIYFEPGDGIPEYYEGNSKLISIHVYDDTPIGIGKITILGELKEYINENGTVLEVPSEWDGVYNVKWEREFQVNKNLANESVVRFYKRPSVSISELVKPIFTKTINTTTDTGNVNGFPLQPPSGQKLSDWRAGTNYLLQRTSGTWDIDVDENVISISSLNYSPTIVEVLNDTDVIVNIPYTGSDGNVTNFSNESFSVSYQDIENETIGETSITGSFAKIDISQLKTFVGDVARVKIFRKSRNAVGDFQFVQEAKLESQELLRDVTTAGNTEVFYGKLTDNNITNYWISSSIDHPISVDSSVLSRAAHIDYNTSAGGVQQLITSQSISLSSDVEYTLNFKTLLSGSISDNNKSIRAFFSSSNFTQDFLTVSGSSIYKAKQDVTQNIISKNTGDAKLVFEVTGDDWFISNISLRNAQDTSFSPDEFTIIQDIPRKTATETFDFRFEFYDVNNNFIPVNVTATKEFDGGNDFPTSGKLFTFESDRNAFRFSSGSIGNPPFQQIQFKTSQQNLTGSVTYASAAFDVDGTYINPSSYTGTYPGALTSVTPAGSIITIANFSGSDNTVTVGSIIYTASLGDLEEFETVYRLEDGDNAPQLVVTSNANQFIYEPTTLSPKPSSQSITVRAQRKNLASLVTPITINSGSNRPGLTYVDTSEGIDTYTISATAFSESFASNDFDSVTYEFTGSDVFGNEQSDEITLSKVVNFDAVSIVLTNEATSFQAKSTGEILGGLVPSSGSVQMFIGSNQISHDDESGGRTKNTFNIISASGDNVTPTDETPNTANYSISAFPSSSDSGSLTLDIEYLAGDNSTSQSFQKIVSYTKSKKAVPTVLTKVSPSSQTINSSSAGFETPQTMEVIVQEGGDEYTYDASLGSPNTFHINSLGTGSGFATFSDEIITLFPSSSEGGIITNGIIGSASIDYRNSEGTPVYDKIVRFDLAVSKIGVDGQNGASGSNAKAVSLTSTKYAVVYDGDGNLFPSSQPYTLTATAQNFTTPEYEFLEDGVSLLSGSSDNTLVVPTDSGSLPTGGDSRLYEVRVKEQGGDYDGVFDNIDVFGVQSGSDAFTAFLTNEAHVFSAKSTGEITSTLSDGNFETRFFRGATQYTYDGSSPYDTNSYRIENVSATFITASQSTVSNQRLFTITGVTETEDNGSITLDIVDNNTGQSFPKTYTFGKSKKGAPVTTISASPQAQSVTSGSGGIGTPSPITIIVNEGGDDYSYLSSGTITANKFRITSITAGTATNNNDGTITPTTPTNDTAIEGAVTMSYTNSEGTAFTGKTIPFSVGVTGLGDTGEQGPQGPDGPTGPSGPGITYVGECSDLTSGYTWTSDSNTRQVTSVSGTYYITKDAADGVAKSTTGCPPDTTYFEAMTSFSSVATDVLFAQDVYANKTVNIGTGVSGNPVIALNADAANTYTNPYIGINSSKYGTSGIYLGFDTGSIAKFSVYNDANNYLRWDGSNLEFKGANAELNSSGEFTSTAGSIGGFTIDADEIKSGTNIGMNSSTKAFSINNTTFGNTGIQLQYNGGTPRAFIGVGDGHRLNFDGSNLILSASNFAVDSSGNVQAANFSLLSAAGASGNISVLGPNGESNFGVSDNGLLSAQTASIEGTITATSGRIGEFTIEGSKLSGKGDYLILDASNTPNIYFYSGSGDDYTTIVKLSSAESLTPIELTTAPTMGGTFPFTGATNTDTETASSSTTATTTQSPTYLYDQLSPTGTYRFPNSSTGNITSNHVGLEMQVSVTLNRNDSGTHSFMFSVGESLSGNVQYLSHSATVGIRMKRQSTQTQVAFAQKSTSNFSLVGSSQIARLGTQSAGGTNHGNAGAGSATSTSLSFTYTITTDDVGDHFVFDTYIQGGTSTVSVSGFGCTLDTTYRAPDVSAMTVSVPVGTDIQPFSELSKGGFQVVSDADPSNLKTVKIPADKDSGNTLIVSGSIEASGNITAFASSDERLKENIITIPNPLEKVNSLNGIIFNWKEGFEQVHSYGTLRDVGVIAQDVQKILPEIVKENVHNHYLGVRYEKLTPLLLEAIKELNKKVEDLENKLKDKE